MRILSSKLINDTKNFVRIFSGKIKKNHYIFKCYDDIANKNLYLNLLKMAYENIENLDIDCFNDEQRPNNLDGDCLEYGQYLMDTGKIDLSDQLYEQYRDDQAEMAYKEKLEMEFNQN